MIDHMGFRVRDLAASRRFYDACAQALGLQVIDNTAESFLIGRSTTQPLPFIWIGTAPRSGRRHTSCPQVPSMSASLRPTEAPSMPSTRPLSLPAAATMVRPGRAGRLK